VGSLEGVGDRVAWVSPTVHELRNAIRAATGRFEREVDASFTKEELRAICETLGVDLAGSERPSTAEMRRLVRTRVGIAASPETAEDGTFRKDELQAIRDGSRP
jgi:hypothetical protein